jgi:hypothetical protein
MRKFAVLATAALFALPASAQGATTLLPFPNDSFTKADKSTDTGKRLSFRASQMPANNDGKRLDPTDINRFDGFSPGSVILAKVPGLDNARALARTKPVLLDDISKFSARNAPVLVVDAVTGERWPIWVEIDSNAKSARDTLLEIHPAKNFLEGRRYIVVLRSLKRSNGKAIKATSAFRRVRDAKKPDKRYKAIWKTLAKAKVKRDDSLYQAWDFTVASEESLSGRMLHIRNEAFTRLGDARLGDGVVEGNAPGFTLTEKVLTGEDATKYGGRFARILEGTVTVPCYLEEDGCGVGSKFNLGEDGLPTQRTGNVAQAHFYCVVPATATADNPARLSLYGHGLLGRDSEVYTNPDMPKMAAESNMVFCATPWAGMSADDVPNAITVLQDFSRMPTIADRLQQGMLNALFLGRAMTHPAGLASNPLLQQGGRPIVQTNQLFYDGNSQGGIMGGALTAFAPDFTRAVLGVPGMNYSVLLPRSVDFDTYSSIMYPQYPNELERPLVLNLAQLMWDRGEANGVAQHITDDPLPGTPPHTVLMHVAYGDHQVSQFQADVEARTIGASIHTPIYAAGRSPQAKPSWGIPAIRSYPFSGSAIVYWDSGAGSTAIPPLTNVPPRGQQDPHEHPRRTPAARRQKSEFLKPSGSVLDVCGGPCVAAPDVG